MADEFDEVLAAKGVPTLRSVKKTIRRSFSDPDEAAAAFQEYRGVLHPEKKLTNPWILRIWVLASRYGPGNSQAAVAAVTKFGKGKKKLTNGDWKQFLEETEHVTPASVGPAGTEAEKISCLNSGAAAEGPLHPAAEALIITSA
eukprot:CAMPEP_0119130714 /NCGR_PEP_ID=MMETSP1310-20130426/8518_1 /TAXON_ID=464262 /ORGANISM="Genus nov. species nov., Strain RCC2339" /LENGTH=143 /DNA_ID=CAMNT_0007121243 /DNA_START=155 /DNA_END=586 /DNA_ORIENTATION=+